MPRLPRLKPQDRPQNYHLYNRIAGPPGDYPMQQQDARQLFLSILFFYSDIYFCLLSAFAVLGNHYHSVVHFQAFVKLSRTELRKLAVRLYEGKLYKPYLFWREKQWRRFNQRLFDVSEFMRNVEQSYAVAHNKMFGRRGRLWADRFKSTLLESWSSVQAAVLYVEMNAVRAGLADRPEEYRFSSAWLRLRPNGRSCCLLPLTRLWHVSDRGKAVRLHFAHLYHRGGIRIDNEDELIRDIIRQDVEDGFTAGIDRNRHRYFNDAVVLGDADQIRCWQHSLLSGGSRTREPVQATTSGLLYMLRKPRRDLTMNVCAA